MNYRLFTTQDTGPQGYLTDGLAVTGANTYYSKPISCLGSDGFGMTIRWTGTPTGTFTVWRTDRRDPDLATDTDWTQDPDFNGVGVGTLATGGIAGIKSFSNAIAKNWKWRIKYVNTSGTGVVFVDASKNRNY